MAPALNDYLDGVSPLPPFRRYATSNEPESGKAILLPSEEPSWKTSPNKDAAAYVAYTTTGFPVSLVDGEDIRRHEDTMLSGTLGLVNPAGTVCRIVDIGPGREAIMHRTKSIDFGVVLEGVVEMVLDSGQRCTLGRSDIVVQRATMHGWRNPSSEEWARMFFVLQPCEDVMVGSEKIDEDLSQTGGSFLINSSR